MERLEPRLLLAAPVAADDGFSTDEGEPVSGNLFGNNGHGADSDGDLDPLLVTQINSVAVTDGEQIELPSGALLTIHSDGTFTYDANGEDNGLAEDATATDGFTYTISDGHGGTDEAIATITVTGVNDNPAATADSVSVNSNTTATGNLVTADNGHGVDSDPDFDDDPTLTEINGTTVTDGQTVTLPSGARLTIHDDGSYTYDPHGVYNSLTHGQTATNTFTYTIEDEHGVESTATVTVTIYGPNAAPSASDNTNSTDDDTPVGGNLITDNDGDGVDTDPNGDTLTVRKINGAAVTNGQIVVLPSGARLTIHADGSYTYDSHAAFDELDVGESDTDSFTYTIGDGNVGTSTATVTITINGVNDAPAATDDDIFVNSDDTAGGNLITDDNGHGADVDPEGDSFDVTAVNGQTADVGQQITLVSGALLTINADGTYTYDPNGIYDSLAHGETDTESFNYTVEDEHGVASTATVTVTIGGPNDAPTATDNDIAVGENGSIAGNLIAADNGHGTDSDPEGDELTVIGINGEDVVADEQVIILPSGAAVMIFKNGTYAYFTNGAFEDLAVGETTTDSFTYTISDGNGGTATANVTVTITGANDAPDAVNNTNTVGEDATVGGNLITDNSGTGIDVDPDASDELSITHINGIAVTDGQVFILPGGARLTIHADGSYTYDPHGSFSDLNNGETENATFGYTITDGHGGSASATVTITVNGSNDAPAAADDDIETDESDAVTGNLITDNNGHGPDADPESDVLSVTQINGSNVTNGQVITLPSGARLTIQSNGNYSYDPHGAFDDLAEGEQDTDTFTYTVSDGHGGTDTATVTVTIEGYDDRADVKVVRKGEFVNLSMKGVQLGADIDIVFTDDGVRLIGRHGTTINGLAMLEFDGVDSVRGILGSGDDQIHVTGEADLFKLDLREGDNAITFEDFVSQKLTTVISKLGGLDFEAIDTEFQKLLVQTGAFDDSVTFDGTTVLTTANVKLLGGRNEILIDGSSFEGNAVFLSNGADSTIEIESGLGNGSDTEFLGNVKFVVGADAAIDLSNLLLSDDTSFEKGVTLVAKKPEAVLTVSRAFFEKTPKLTNIHVIA